MGVCSWICWICLVRISLGVGRGHLDFWGLVLGVDIKELEGGLWFREQGQGGLGSLLLLSQAGMC